MLLFLLNRAVEGTAVNAYLGEHNPKYDFAFYCVEDKLAAQAPLFDVMDKQNLAGINIGMNVDLMLPVPDFSMVYIYNAIHS